MHNVFLQRTLYSYYSKPESGSLPDLPTILITIFKLIRLAHSLDQLKTLLSQTNHHGEQPLWNATHPLHNSTTINDWIDVADHLTSRELTRTLLLHGNEETIMSDLTNTLEDVMVHCSKSGQDCDLSNFERY